MRILISTYGSRGDVQPMAGLAVALQALGVEVRVSAPADSEFEELLDRAGVPMVPAFMSVHQWIATARQPGKGLPDFAAAMMPAQYDAIAAAAAGCDAIVATGLFPSIAAAQAVAETLGIPYVWTTFCPTVLPSPHHPPMPYPGWPLPAGVTDNAALWAHNAEAMDALFGAAVNGQRAAVGLRPLDHVRDHVFTARPFLAANPVLGPWEPTELDVVHTGAWFLPDPRPLPDALEAFLEAGAPPVYIGFGSMAMQGAPGAARAAIEAVRAQGRRALLARGWAGLAAIDGSEDCFVVGEVSQRALFPRVAAVVHHGGAGTTAAAARAGAPQLIVPQVADQPYWAGRVAALGIGAAHPGPVPGFESLSAGLATVLASEIRARAEAVAGAIRTDGAMLAAKALLAGLGRCG